MAQVFDEAWFKRQYWYLCVPKNVMEDYRQWQRRQWICDSVHAELSARK